MNLSKPFGGLVCTIQLAAFTGAILWLRNFIPATWTLVVFAALLSAVFVGATQFFDRVLSFSDDERALWVAFTPALASAILWGAYAMFLSIRERLGSLTVMTDGAGLGSIVNGYAAGMPLLTPVILQIALLVGAYMLLWPRFKSGALKKSRLLLPLAGPILGALLGWWLATSFLG